jgi:hypothetical protein
MSSVVLDEREDTAQKVYQGKLMKRRNCCRRLTQMGSLKMTVLTGITT